MNLLTEMNPERRREGLFPDGDTDCPVWGRQPIVGVKAVIRTKKYKNIVRRFRRERKRDAIMAFLGAGLFQRPHAR